AHAPVGPRGRDDRRRGLPGQRGILVYDRPGTGHRRRADRDELTCPRPHDRRGRRVRAGPSCAGWTYSVHHSSSLLLALALAAGGWPAWVACWAGAAWVCCRGAAWPAAGAAGVAWLTCVAGAG